MQKQNPKFHPGCYVDGARGIYAVNAIVEFASFCGFTLPDEICECDYCEGNPPSLIDEFTPHSCEFWCEIEDEATEFMNDTHALNGHWWGRNESGDWGLWEDEES